MEKIIRIKTEIDLDGKLQVKKWTIKQPDSPWIINPDCDESDEKSDIAFDGMDLSTSQDNRIKDIAFTLSLDHLKNFDFQYDVPIKKGEVFLLEDGYIQATEYGEQDILFDKSNKILRWQFDANEDELLIRIAENVIIGTRNNHLQSIYIWL